MQSVSTVSSEEGRDTPEYPRPTFYDGKNRAKFVATAGQEEEDEVSEVATITNDHSGDAASASAPVSIVSLDVMPEM
jgi:hypothetical protein